MTSLGLDWTRKGERGKERENIKEERHRVCEREREVGGSENDRETLPLNRERDGERAGWERERERGRRACACARAPQL